MDYLNVYANTHIKKKRNKGNNEHDPKYHSFPVRGTLSVII